MDELIDEIQGLLALRHEDFVDAVEREDVLARATAATHAADERITAIQSELETALDREPDGAVALIRKLRDEHRRLATLRTVARRLRERIESEVPGR